MKPLRNDLSVALGAIGFINVAVYIYMYLNGVDPVHPSIDDLIHYGANYAPRVAAGEWWRILTAMFLHGGFLHLFCNMGALYQASTMLDFADEDEILAVYFLSGIVAAIFSLFAHPFSPAVGASGAIMGLYGAIVMYRLLRREVNQVVFKKQQLIIALITLIGAVVPLGRDSHVDIACHMGGAIAGLVFGFCLSYRGERSKFDYAMITLSALCFLSIMTLPKRPDMIRVMKELTADSKEFEKLDAELREKRNKLLSAKAAREMEDFLDVKVNPLLTRVQEKLASIDNLHDAKYEVSVSEMRARAGQVVNRIKLLAALAKLDRENFEMIDANKSGQISLAQATDQILSKLLPELDLAEREYSRAIPAGKPTKDEFLASIDKIREGFVQEAVASELGAIRKTMIADLTKYINLVKSPAQTEASTLQGLQFLDSQVREHLNQQMARISTFPKAMKADGKIDKYMDANRATYAVMRTYALECVLRFRFSNLAMKLQTRQINATGAVSFVHAMMEPLLVQYSDVKSTAPAQTTEGVRKLASARGEVLHNLNMGIMASNQMKISQSVNLWKAIDQSRLETEIWATFAKLSSSLQIYSASAALGY